MRCSTEASNTPLAHPHHRPSPLTLKMGARVPLLAAKPMLGCLSQDSWWSAEGSSFNGWVGGGLAKTRPRYQAPPVRRWPPSAAISIGGPQPNNGRPREESIPFFLVDVVIAIPSSHLRDFLISILSIWPRDWLVWDAHTTSNKTVEQPPRPKHRRSDYATASSKTSSSSTAASIAEKE
jgi:hypothetical protein